MNIRLFLPALLILFAFNLGSGCSGSAPEDSVAGPMILKAGNGTEPKELDPHLVSGMNEHRLLSALFEGLADIDPATGDAVPAAADAWEISEDGTVYTFHIRETAKWSNGDPLTAQDFVYAWQRILTPTFGAEYAYMLHCLKNAKAFNEGTLEDFSQVGVKALDDRTLEVTLAHPTPYFVSMQYHQSWFPVHKATIEQFGAMAERGTAWTRAGNLVSNGAFTLTEWSPGEVIRVARNEHYWDKENVRLDGVEFYPIDNLVTEEREFRVGNLHMTESVPFDQIPGYQRDHPEELINHPYIGSYYYRFNVTKPPLDDRRVRRALQISLNREMITQNVLKAGEEPAYFYTPPDTAGYTCEYKVPYDLEEAKRLLAEAGFPDGEGFPQVEILYNTLESHKLIAEAAQRMWKESLGINVGLYNQDWKTYLNSMDMLSYDICRSSWIADVVDPINFLECFLSTSGNNRTGFASEEYDRLINLAYNESDVEKRKGHMQQAEALLLEEAVIVPVYFYRWVFLVKPEVQGFVPNSRGYRRWKDMYLATDETVARAN